MKVFKNYQELRDHLEDTLGAVRRDTVIRFVESAFDFGQDDGITVGWSQARRDLVTNGSPEEEVEDAYENGYEEGRERGYDDGYSEGEQSGYAEGERDGIEKGAEEGRNEAYDEGYEDGRNA